MAERVRAGGAGIYGFFTRVGAGTLVAEGKETRIVNGETYILETGIMADVSLVKAWKGDTEGNLDLPQDRAQFQSEHGHRRPDHRRRGRGTGGAGELDPDQIHTPGIYRSAHHRRQPLSQADREAHGSKAQGGCAMPWSREDLAARAARELKDGFYVNLGIGIPTLVANYIAPGLKVVLQSENGMLGIGPFPYEGEEDPDLINAGKQTVSELPMSSYFSSADSFAMIRGGHIDMAVLGAHGGVRKRRSCQLDGARQDGQGHGRRHGSGRRRKARRGSHGAHLQGRVSRNSSRRCELPLTGTNVVDMLITDLAVFSRGSRQEPFRLIEIAPGVTAEEVRSKTPAHFIG